MFNFKLRITSAISNLAPLCCGSSNIRRPKVVAKQLRWIPASFLGWCEIEGTQRGAHKKKPEQVHQPCRAHQPYWDVSTNVSRPTATISRNAKAVCIARIDRDQISRSR